MAIPEVHKVKPRDKTAYIVPKLFFGIFNFRFSNVSKLERAFIQGHQ